MWCAGEGSKNNLLMLEEILKTLDVVAAAFCIAAALVALILRLKDENES
jgi:hypothetical protein